MSNFELFSILDLKIINIFILFLISLCILSFTIIFHLYKKINYLKSENLELEKNNIKLLADNNYLSKTNLEIKSNLEQSEHNLKLQFENYVNKLVDNKTEFLNKEANKTLVNINNILDPFKEKLSEFQSKVDKTYQEESREIFSLKNEINKLLANNLSMAKETENLTNALKGNVKAQGIWGEIILEKILETSGLREGHEYILQGKNLDLKDENKQSQRPDVIVNLPDNKHIIIDAKVSLTHYEQYIATKNEDFLQSFIKSIQAHISNLSGKSYQYNDRLVSPDFVILFFPIEGAFSLALQHNPDLFSKAWHSKIIIVSPTTLFATLKTVASLWLFEKQNKNAIRIAKEAGLLYDKFVSFVEDMHKIGQALDKADEVYNNALSKLANGRGNIVSKAEKIKALGAKAKKKLDESDHNSLLVNDTDVDNNQMELVDE